MAFQHWYCERCGVESTARHKKHTGVQEVRDLIALQHQRRAKGCAEIHGLAHVRLGFPVRGQEKS